MSLGRSDVTDRPVAVLARLMREEGEKLLDSLAQNLEALLGHPVKLEAIDPRDEAVSQSFGGAPVYVFPIEDQQSHPLPSLLAIDFGGAVNAGAAFSLMGAEQIEEVLSSKEIPETLHDSIGEVANVLCGAAVNVLRDLLPEDPDYHRGSHFELVEAAAWPGLLSRVDASLGWDLVAARLLIDGEKKGALVLAASAGAEGMIRPEEIAAAASVDSEATDPPPEAADADSVSADPEVAPSPAAAVDPPEVRESKAEDGGAASRMSGEAMDEAGEKADTGENAGTGPCQGLSAQLAAHGADAGALGLRSLLEKCGVTVRSAQTSEAQSDALFVVSRSPTDMVIRLESLARPPQRPSLVIACSDRPTRDMVVAARSAGVDAFLVLPTTRDKLTELLAKIPSPAAT